MQRKTIHLVFILLAVIIPKVGSSIDGTVDVRWPVAHDFLTGPEGTFYPGEKIKLVTTGKIDVNPAYWTERRCKVLDTFDCEDIHREQHFYYSVDQWNMGLRLVKKKNDEEVLPVFGINAAQSEITIPANQIDMACKLQGFVPGDNINRAISLGGYTVDISVDSTGRLSLIQQYLTSGRRTASQLQDLNVLNLRLKDQFPDRLASMILQHVESFYPLPNNKDEEQERLLQVAQNLAPSDASVGIRLAKYYIAIGNFPEGEEVAFKSLKTIKDALDKDPSINNLIHYGDACEAIGQVWEEGKAGIQPGDLSKADAWYSDASNSYKKAGDTADYAKLLMARGRVLRRIRSIPALESAKDLMSEAVKLLPKKFHARFVTGSPDGEFFAVQDSRRGIILLSPGEKLTDAASYSDSQSDITILGKNSAGHILVQIGYHQLALWDPNNPSNPPEVIRSFHSPAIRGAIQEDNIYILSIDQPSEDASGNPSAPDYAQQSLLHIFLKNGTERTEPSGYIFAVASKGNIYAIGDLNSDKTVVKRADTGEIIAEVHSANKRPCDGLVLSNTGRFLACTTLEDFSKPASNTLIYVWDISQSSAKLIFTQTESPDSKVSWSCISSNCMLFSSDESTLLKIQNGKGINLYRIDGQKTKTLTTKLKSIDESSGLSMQMLDDNHVILYSRLSTQIAVIDSATSSQVNYDFDAGIFNEDGFFIKKENGKVGFVLPLEQGKFTLYDKNFLAKTSIEINKDIQGGFILTSGEPLLALRKSSMIIITDLQSNQKELDPAQNFQNAFLLSGNVSGEWYIATSSKPSGISKLIRFVGLDQQDVYDLPAVPSTFVQMNPQPTASGPSTSATTPEWNFVFGTYTSQALAFPLMFVPTGFPAMQMQPQAPNSEIKVPILIYTSPEKTELETWSLFNLPILGHTSDGQIIQQDLVGKLQITNLNGQHSELSGIAGAYAILSSQGDLIATFSAPSKLSVFRFINGSASEVNCSTCSIYDGDTIRQYAQQHGGIAAGRPGSRDLKTLLVPAKTRILVHDVIANRPIASTTVGMPVIVSKDYVVLQTEKDEFEFWPIKH